MFVKIKKNNRDNFRDIVAEEILERIGDEEDLFGIGVTENLKSLPCGALVFENSIETDEDGEEQIVSSILWLYVREDAREYGIATGLFAEYLTVIGAYEDDVYPIPVVDMIRVDVPMDPSYNLLCNVLEDFGFTFSFEELPTLMVKLGRLYEADSLKHFAGRDIVPLRKVPRDIFYDGLISCAGEWELGDKSIFLDKKDYEPDVSMVYLSEGRPKAFLLVRDSTKNLLDVLLLRKTTDCPEDIKLELIAKALEEAKYGYLPETIIRASCDTKESALFADTFFPDVKPLLVRRGYFG